MKNTKQLEDELRALSASISLRGRQALTREQTAKIDELKIRLEYRLKELEKEFHVKELELKVEIWKEIVNTLDAS